jgi:hypothetical protein
MATFEDPGPEAIANRNRRSQHASVIGQGCAAVLLCTSGRPICYAVGPGWLARSIHPV